MNRQQRFEENLPMFKNRINVQLRDAIQELRERQKLPPGRQIDLTLDKYLNTRHK